jgi:hypothetical protein
MKEHPVNPPNPRHLTMAVTIARATPGGWLAPIAAEIGITVHLQGDQLHITYQSIPMTTKPVNLNNREQLMPSTRDFSATILTVKTVSEKFHGSQRG